MSNQFAKATIGLAAEFAVASELCRRGIYAQLTLGQQKRTDILVFSESGRLARVEVKAKSGRVWPNCKGIFGANVYLVFVDYEKRSESEPPDFYVLSSKNWRSVLEARVAEIHQKDPNKKVFITNQNVAVFPEQINQSGKPYEGMSIRDADVAEYRDCWKTIKSNI